MPVCACVYELLKVAGGAGFTTRSIPYTRQCVFGRRTGFTDVGSLLFSISLFTVWKDHKNVFFSENVGPWICGAVFGRRV